MNRLLARTAAPRRSLRVLGAIARGRSLPFSMTFILTNRCNFRCTYCDIPEHADKEMTVPQFQRAIDELVVAGMARASFSGGEPLVRKDAASIIGHARSSGVYTSLNSNGWFTRDAIEDLAPHLDMLMVSLDGPRDVHDRVRRQEGSFDRAIATLRRARELGLATSTISVLGPWNLDRIDDVLQLAEEHGFWAYFQPAYEECFNHRAGLHPVFDPAVFASVAEELERARSGGRRVGASPGYIERLRRGPAFSDCTTCRAGRYFGTVLADGRVIPCHLLADDEYANGLDVGFAEAFRRIPRQRTGSGCAISPYQESDLIFRLDPRAVGAALARQR